jgi:hydroxymethylpyrimidine/phosphomethylpyrimidine kinase
MLSMPETILADARGLPEDYDRPVVLDPVMVAASGDSLLTESAIATLKTALLPRATLLTPNLPEAARLLDCPVARTETGMLDQAKRLLALGPGAVLVKGGHGEGVEAVDLLVTPTTTLRLAAPRILSRNAHGTGCTLSSAIAAGLAKGLGLEDAARAAKAYVHAAIAAA